MATLSTCIRPFRGAFSVHKLSGYRAAIHRFGLSTAANTKDGGNEAADNQQTEDEVNTEQLKQLQQEVEKVKTELSDTQDKYKRALAESENIRQRMRKQVDDAKLFGIQGFSKDLLEVSDILGLAIENVPKDQLNNGNPHLVALFEGLNMTEKELQKVFTRHGLVQINPAEGEKFDPNIHEALFEQPIPGKEPGTVAMVTKVGYKLHERTIRAAKVGVVKA